MTVVIEYPPGSAGAPPHKHPSGPAFGYMLEGEMLFELEGEPPRVIHAGEAFWEPGGDVIHYSDANNRDDIKSRFVVTMLCVPGQPMLTLVDDEELAARKHRRVPAQSHTPESLVKECRFATALVGRAEVPRPAAASTSRCCWTGSWRPVVILTTIGARTEIPVRCWSPSESRPASIASIRGHATNQYGPGAPFL